MNVVLKVIGDAVTLMSLGWLLYTSYKIASGYKIKFVKEAYRGN